MFLLDLDGVFGCIAAVNVNQNKNVSHLKWMRERERGRGSETKYVKHFQTYIDPIENLTYLDFIIADPSR